MSYIICCGDKYIKFGAKGHGTTSKKSEAYKWKEMQKAKNMCYTLMGSNKFNNNELKVVECKDDFITMIETGRESSRETFIPNISVVDNVEDNSEVTSAEYMSEYKSLSEKVMMEYEKLQNELSIRKNKLQKEMSEVDMEIVDLKHYAEFYNLNAYDGYKMYKMLHDTTQRRRKIKNEIAEIDSFRNYLKNTKSFHDVLHAEKKYKPRVLKDLFTKGV